MFDPPEEKTAETETVLNVIGGFASSETVPTRQLEEIRRKLKSGQYLTREAAEQTASAMVDHGDA